MKQYTSMNKDFWTEKRIMEFLLGGDDMAFDGVGHEGVFPLPDSIPIFTYLSEGDSVQVHPLLSVDSFDTTEEMTVYAGKWLTVLDASYSLDDDELQGLESPEFYFGPGPSLRLLDSDGRDTAFVWRNMHFSSVRFKNGAYLLPPNLPKKGVF